MGRSLLIGEPGKKTKEWGQWEMWDSRGAGVSENAVWQQGKGEKPSDRQREGKTICLESLWMCSAPARYLSQQTDRQTLCSLLHRKQRTVGEWRNREGSPEICLLTWLCPAASHSAGRSRVHRMGRLHSLIPCALYTAEQEDSVQTCLKAWTLQAKFIIKLGQWSEQTNMTR